MTYVVAQDGDDGSRSQRPSNRGQPKPPGREANMSYGTNADHHHHNNTNNAGLAPQAHGHDAAAAGPSDGAPPPSYAQVVASDHKIQDQS